MDTMGFEFRNRILLILSLLIVGALLASVVSRYITPDEPIKHSVSTGKVGAREERSDERCVCGIKSSISSETVFLVVCNGLL